MIAAGAAVEGHVRPCRGENGVIVELDRVQTRNGWAPFYARLVSVASTQAAGRKHAGSRKKSDPEIPGVAKIVFATRSAELAAGTRMLWRTWRTEPLAVTPTRLNRSWVPRWVYINLTGKDPRYWTFHRANALVLLGHKINILM